MSNWSQVWDGISPCMELGVGDCVVWWDAWVTVIAASALFVAGVSAVVAFWGVLATTVSGVAVWKLGQQANRLAESGAEQVRLERIALEQAQEAERSRQSVIVLSYISAELAEIYPSIAAFAGNLRKENAEEKFVRDQIWRTVWAEDIGSLKVARMENALQQLHRLPSDLGGRIARILGDLDSLQQTMKYAASAVTDGVDPELRQIRESGLGMAFRKSAAASARAAADIAHCSLEASAVASTIADPPRRP